MGGARLCCVVFCLPVVYLAGCIDDQFTTTNEYDTVVTVQNQAYDYGQNGTYYLVSEVGDLLDFVSDPYPIPNRKFWEDFILFELERNMNQLGYTKVESRPEDADVVLGAAMVASENWAFASYGYYPWWGGYGWYYYYPYTYTTVAVSFATGSLILVMLDPERSRNLSDDNNAGIGGDAGGDVFGYEAIWAAGLHGILDGVNQAEVRNGIDQAFRQSPYLRVGGEQ
jgi:hypothetical protein